MKQPETFIFCQSGKISSNLVTQGASNLRGSLDHPAFQPPLCFKQFASLNLNKVVVGNGLH